MSDNSLTIQVSPLTSEQVARFFWALDDDQMCEFFAELERIAGTNLCFQMAGVIHKISERADAGDYSALQGFQTMLSHAQQYADGSTGWRVAKAKYAVAKMAEDATNDH